MKRAKVELTENEIFDINAIERELSSVAKQIESDCEAVIVSEFMEQVATTYKLTPWRIACLASTCAFWAHHRGYWKGLTKARQLAEAAL